ncbi:MAG: DUF2996 domain-containing protein [Snowella sp.]|nr:DUF2996 domain-containing protein [Snowella sp.]
MAEETKPTPEASTEETPAVDPKPAKAAKAAPTADKAPAAKKAKEPALEDKPFAEFMEKDFVPTLQKALDQEGLKEISVSFKKQPLPTYGADPNEQCWQVEGIWQKGQRQFNLYFWDENINGQKGFSFASGGSKPSTIESFMIDERKVTLDLMVRYLIQRLNGQKWLILN